MSIKSWNHAKNASSIAKIDDHNSVVLLTNSHAILTQIFFLKFGNTTVFQVFPSCVFSWFCTPSVLLVTARTVTVSSQKAVMTRTKFNEHTTYPAYESGMMVHYPCWRVNAGPMSARNTAMCMQQTNHSHCLNMLATCVHSSR